MKYLLSKTFTFSLFCHIFCFVLIGFTLPKSNSKDYEIRFLGSFLSKIDFLNSATFNSSIKEDRAHGLDDLFVEKISISDNGTYVISKISKPIIANKVLEKNIFLVSNKKDDIIDLEKISSSLIYDPLIQGALVTFKNNMPSNLMKVKLDIAKDGRVRFVERIESSGSLESDLLVRERCLDYIFYPSFDNEPKIKKINLCELTNAKN